MRYGFFIVMVLLLLSAVSYVTTRGVQAFAPVSFLKNGYWIILGTLFSMLLVSFFLPHNISPAVARTVTFLGYSFLILLLYLLMAFLLIDLVRAANSFFRFLPDVSAFRFWAAVAGIFAVLLTMAIGNYRFNHPETVGVTISLSEKNRPGKLKIVAVSDIHLGHSIDKKRLKKYVEMINAEQPDLVLIAGDLIDRLVQPVTENKMDEELRRIQSSLGVYEVPGNHEYYGESFSAVADFYKQANIELLIDTIAAIGDGIYIIGRDDATQTERKPLSQLTKGLDPQIPKILLDHQPHRLQEAVENGIDLQFSGHTHNGQIFPGNLIVKQVYELSAGYKKIGKTHFVVSSGLGIWGPQYRICSRSEIIVIDFEY